MMNNNIQVSLRNGANFSHIRMALKGTKIPSLQTGGITHLSGDWYNTIFSSFRLQMLTDLAAAKTPEEKQTIIEKYNNLQAAYGKLRPQFPNLASTNFNQAVKDYQNLINSGFSFVNTLGIANGVNTNRYKKIGTANRIGKDLSDKWESDGLWAGQTLDRTTLGYKGDWDENSDAFKTWQKSLNDIGMETYLDADNTYKLRLLSPSVASKPALPTVTTSVTSNNASEPSNGLSNPYEPVEYEYTPGQGTIGKFRFPTFPLYNAALLGVANTTNKRILDTQLKAPSMRYEGWDPYAKVTDAWTTRTANNQALQEHNWGIQLSINNSSDLGKRNKMEAKLREAELQTKLQNNLLLNQEYNQTSLNLQNTENLGKQIRSDVANKDRQAAVGEARDRLNAISQYQAQLGLNLQENIMANYTDWKAWNRNNMLQDYADWQSAESAKVQADLQAAYDEYLNSGDITKWSEYNNLWKANMLDNEEASDTTNFGKTYAMWLKDKPLAKASDPALQKQFLNEHLGESFGGELDAFWLNWADYKANALNRYATALRNINTSWGLAKGRYNPLQFNGEVSPWLWRAMNGAPPSYQRQYMKKGGRFLEYLEHNRRAEKEIRDTTMKSIQESRKILRRDLDALDRESLLLLRAIFK